MKVQPSDTSGNNCESLTCLSDGCSAAYGYPTDDWKVKVCDNDVDITLTICPSGSSFTNEDESSSTNSNTIVAIICILALLCCIIIGVGTYCFIKRRKQKAAVSFEENKEENDTKLEEDGDKTGYDMKPIDTTQQV
eukprot:CAMPEP_0201571500 /NCGR_PEP_ID=MMETSP0190_2-20130828/14302_1 /ASSEMBLY_ACC=CAM_ASM_000263 /TAXON_ID=37353 /ORGANISM="Rosalina sp." /LENGTH=135 /DNA_ID=CAMNT_0047996219 /DNA_START=408 /DNA_END=815 /DNA_ORIENTATION=-